MPRILALDGVSEEGIAVFTEAGFEVDARAPMKPEELAAVVGEYDGLVVRSATKVTAESLQNPGRLKVIGRAGVGTDNIDKNAATAKGIVVMNVPGGNTISTCEHTFAMMMALCRNIPQAHASMEAGRWDRKNFMGVELRGKTLGVVGVGRIGGEVAKRALAFEMKVLAFDPLLTPLKAETLGVELVSLDELIERADFITVHAPKTDKTLNMLRAEHFPRMKPSCRLINCARGGILNEKDLAQALRDKHIAGAALDVYTSEPFTDNPFIGLDNIVMTPHLAASTDEAQLCVAVEVAQQMVEYLKTGAIVNAVNVPSLDSETRAALQPLLSLAERMGRFQALYTRGAPRSIEVAFSGDLGVTDTYPITAAVLMGFLAPTVETVNMVSAPAQLAARGIECNEKRTAHNSDYSFEIGVTLVTDQETHVLKGTLFQSRDPRVCSIDGMRVDAKPEGCMLVCENEDKPLVIGRLATLIGNAGINIANMVLGRDKRGGKALTLLNLDQPLADDVMDEVRRMTHVTDARLIVLPEAE